MKKTRQNKLSDDPKCAADDKRQRTTTLFTAIDASRRGRCMQRHRQQDHPFLNTIERAGRQGRPCHLDNDSTTQKKGARVIGSDEAAAPAVT